MVTLLIMMATLLAHFKENKLGLDLGGVEKDGVALVGCFVKTDAALYKGFAELGITAARQGATLVALYDTRPHGIGGGGSTTRLKNCISWR